MSVQDLIKQEGGWVQPFQVEEKHTEMCGDGKENIVQVVASDKTGFPGNEWLQENTLVACKVACEFVEQLKLGQSYVKPCVFLPKLYCRFNLC